jgi:thioredoxin reductase (NADPH)
MHTKLAIIGSGPAGLSAAIYAARADLKPLVFAGKTPGGQLTTTTLVENFPGFPDGVMGPELMQNMIKQAEKFGAETIYQQVDKLDASSHPFKITDGAGTGYEADAVIIATGAEPRWLNVPGEKELTAKGVHTCATCDGAFYRGKNIAVIGGGDSAMEEANFLTRFADKVTVIHRRDTLRASAAMVERAKANPKIYWLWNKEVTAFVGDAHLTELKLKDTVTGEESTVPFDGAFLAIGHEPNVHLIKDVVGIKENGYIDAENAPHTNIDGLFVAGDVYDSAYRQAITAAGAGAAAAITAQHWLADK